MATAGGAKACGLNECDALAEGKLADLIMIDLHQPNMQPLNNIAKKPGVQREQAECKAYHGNGRILYENGEFFVGEDPEYIYEKQIRSSGAAERRHKDGDCRENKKQSCG